MTSPRFLALLLLPLASLTGATPISARSRFNETSLAEPLDGQSVSVGNGVLETFESPTSGSTPRVRRSKRSSVASQPDHDSAAEPASEGLDENSGVSNSTVKLESRMNQAPYQPTIAESTFWWKIEKLEERGVKQHDLIPAMVVAERQIRPGATPVALRDWVASEIQRLRPLMEGRPSRRTPIPLGWQKPAYAAGFDPPPLPRYTIHQSPGAVPYGQPLPARPGPALPAPPPLAHIAPAPAAVPAFQAPPAEPAAPVLPPYPPISLEMPGGQPWRVTTNMAADVRARYRFKSYYGIALAQALEELTHEYAPYSPRLDVEEVRRRLWQLVFHNRKSKRSPPASQPGHDSAPSSHSTAPNSNPGGPKGTVQSESSATKPDDSPKAPSISDEDKPFGWLLDEIELPESFRDPDIPIVPNSRPAPASEAPRSNLDAGNAGRKLESRQNPPVDIPAGSEDDHRWAWQAYQDFLRESRPDNNKHRVAMVLVSNSMAEKYPQLFSDGRAAMPACNVWVREGKILLDPNSNIPALDTSMLPADLDALWSRMLDFDKSGMPASQQVNDVYRWWRADHKEVSWNAGKAAFADLRVNMRWRMEGRGYKYGQPTPGHIPSQRYSATAPAMSILELAYAAQGAPLPFAQAAPPDQTGPAPQVQAAAPEAGPSTSRRERNIGIIRDLYCTNLERGMSPDQASREIVEHMLMWEPWRTQKSCEDAVQAALQDLA